jgi:hypothetical protein
MRTDFTKEHTEIANALIKRFSASLGIRECKIKPERDTPSVLVSVLLL